MFLASADLFTIAFSGANLAKKYEEIAAINLTDITITDEAQTVNARC